MDALQLLLLFMRQTSGPIEMAKGYRTHLVDTENFIRVDDAPESPKLAE